MQRFFRHHPHWAIVFIAIFVVSFYWLFIAQDRYVSRATVVLESPQISTPEISFASLMGGGGANTHDLLLLREYLLSVDMLRRLDKEFNIRQHYSEHGDLFARLHNIDAPIEDLHKYYLRRVNVELDEYAGVLNIEVQAYTPEFAHQIATAMLAAGEHHMNDMGHRLAAEQVRFLEQQIQGISQQFSETRAALLNYENEHGLVSPTDTVASVNQVVATLEGELARLQAKHQALASFQSNRSSEIHSIKSEIKALQDQINIQRSRLAQSTGKSLNKISSQYEALMLQAQFAQETYSNALAALENTRLGASRQLKQISVLQSPLLPEYSTEPKRFYNSSLFAIISLFLGFIFSMLLMIIRDHRD